MKKIIFIIFATILFFPSFVFADVLDSQTFHNYYYAGGCSPTYQGFILNDDGAGGSWLVENWQGQYKKENSWGGRFCISSEITGVDSPADCMQADNGQYYVRISNIPAGYMIVDIHDITLTAGTYYIKHFYGTTYSYMDAMPIDYHLPNFDYWGARQGYGGCKLQQTWNLWFEINGIYYPPAEDKKPGTPIFLLTDNNFILYSFFALILILIFSL